MIDTFSDDYRIPITMHLAGYHYGEIAKRLNVPVGTIKSRIFYARKRLTKLLSDYDYNPS